MCISYIYASKVPFSSTSQNEKPKWVGFPVHRSPAHFGFQSDVSTQT
jgi:hypothetical protein